MSDLAKLDKRVTKLEREMGDVRKLAADASAEVGEVHAMLRAHTKSLEALRETQLEQGSEIRALRSEMREGFATMGVGMAEIKAMLEIAIDQSDES
jgi:predicted metal-dependent enzyme (double-stranded beta helix superfamily)